MNDNIGTLFTETRQGKGISVDEAAEAIRIRIEYIEAIEAGVIDFNLPDIYKRGFYKSYADYLGLNVEEMMAKCPIRPFETLESSQKRREMVSQVAKKTQEVDHDNLKTSFTDDIANPPRAPSSPKIAFHKTAAFKIGGILLGSATLLFLILYGIIAHLGNKQIKAITQDNISELIQKRIVLRSSGDVKVMVRSEKDKSKIFSGTLSKGGEKMITYEKPIELYFNHGESLTIEMDSGEYLHPDSGRGGIQIK
ncbi:MAG: helix-turn-helix domain-containing protein [Puniceicoccales bacterium]|nr:helix-turn-helix domain-containing protein [Puniceicoccales bacterium]